MTTDPSSEVRAASGHDAPHDERLMRLAIEQAKKGVGRTTPNPAVGAVIASADGEVLATGHHAYAGGDHAEVAALRKLDFQARGLDLYSTLEPCDHVGRTGPCTEAIIRAGIRRVVFGSVDPNPRVHGKGRSHLEQAGVAVRAGVLEADCRALNEAFNFAIVERRPFVVLKMAASLDGKIATWKNESQWITSEAARLEGRKLRDQLDAVLVGVNTVLADDPQLTARIPDARDPVRIVLDSRLRTPSDAKLIATAKSIRTVIATTKKASERKRKALEKLGAEVWVLPRDRGDRVALEPLLDRIHNEAELNSVLVEGGASVHGAFIDARLVNKVVAFVAPMLIGGEGARTAIGGRGAGKLSEALGFVSWSFQQVGPDLMITAYPTEVRTRAAARARASKGEG